MTTQKTNEKATKITARNRAKWTAYFAEQFPACPEANLEAIMANAKDTHIAEDAIETVLDQMGRVSKVPVSYKQKYAALKAEGGDGKSNNDGFAQAFADLLTIRGVNGKATCDVGMLREVADANDAWDAKYEKLNPGMQRMNVGNKLRARVKRGELIQWPNGEGFAAKQFSL
jgi:hypothetical protein